MLKNASVAGLGRETERSRPRHESPGGRRFRRQGTHAHRLATGDAQQPNQREPMPSGASPQTGVPVPSGAP